MTVTSSSKAHSHGSPPREGSWLISTTASGHAWIPLGKNSCSRICTRGGRFLGRSGSRSSTVGERQVPTASRRTFSLVRRRRVSRIDGAGGGARRHGRDPAARRRRYAKEDPRARSSLGRHRDRLRGNDPTNRGPAASARGPVGGLRGDPRARGRGPWLGG